MTMVEVTAGTAARVRDVPITAHTPLRTVRGTLEQLATVQPGDAWLRVYVREPPRAGLREEVQELLPRALEVRIDPAMLADQLDGAPAGAAGPAGPPASCSATTWPAAGTPTRRSANSSTSCYDEVSH